MWVNNEGKTHYHFLHLRSFITLMYAKFGISKKCKQVHTGALECLQQSAQGSKMHYLFEAHDHSATTSIWNLVFTMDENEFMPVQLTYDDSGLRMEVGLIIIFHTLERSFT